MKCSSGLCSRHAIVALSIALVGCGTDEPTTSPAPTSVGSTPSAAALRVGVLPQLAGTPYTEALRRGAEEAARELGVELRFDAPARPLPELQTAILDEWVGRGIDAVAVAPNDPFVLAPAFIRSTNRGVSMLSFDSDASPTGSRRIRFVSPATETEVARLLVDSLIDATQGVGEVVIVTGAAEAPNRNAWTFRIQRLLESSYPKIRLLDTIVTEENAERTREKTESILRKRPDLAAVISLGETTLPVVARTVRDAGLRGKVFVSGIGLPSTVSEFVADGTIPSFVSWNPVDLGYLAVHAAKAARGGSLKSGPSTFGRLTTIQVTEDEIILGSPVRFGRDNADPPPY